MGKFGNVLESACMTNPTKESGSQVSRATSKQPFDEDNLMGTEHKDFCDTWQYVTQVSSEV